ncbi:MAG: toxin-antitoxin system HicB family antitoxin [Acidobacteria bacterium]|nr:toxin-antitoxin system HicB family antitoxin [Acidobacteriota bacterium]
MERNLDDYPFEVRRLTADEGDGFLVNFPDFSECFSDGETVEEAIANGRDALVAVIEALEAKGLPVPEPGGGAIYSGRFVLRVPRSTHARLVERARAEGVSLNTLVLTLVCEGLGKR